MCVKLCLEIQALTDFLCSNNIEILNVAGPRESKEPGVYEWTLNMLRFSLNRAVSGAGSTETANRGGYGGQASRLREVKRDGPQLDFLGQPREAGKNPISALAAAIPSE
jgi:hypothetical protein